MKLKYPKLPGATPISGVHTSLCEYNLRPGESVEVDDRDVSSLVATFPFLVKIQDESKDESKENTPNSDEDEKSPEMVDTKDEENLNDLPYPKLALLASKLGLFKKGMSKDDLRKILVNKKDELS